MYIREVRKRIEKISVCSDDTEKAHWLEDELYTEFIEFVALSANKKLSALAIEVLKAKDLDFERWYA